MRASAPGRGRSLAASGARLHYFFPCLRHTAASMAAVERCRGTRPSQDAVPIGILPGLATSPASQLLEVSFFWNGLFLAGNDTARIERGNRCIGALRIKSYSLRLAHRLNTESIVVGFRLPFTIRHRHPVPIMILL